MKKFGRFAELTYKKQLPNPEGYGHVNLSSYLGTKNQIAYISWWPLLPSVFNTSGHQVGGNGPGDVKLGSEATSVGFLPNM